MTNAMPWLRLYSEAINDPKVTRLCLKTQLPRYAILGAITSLLCIANDSPIRGKLMISEDNPLSLEEILYMTGMDDGLIKALLEVGILALEGDIYGFPNWNKRQAPSESVERVRRYRERKKQEGNVTVTVTETPNVTECNANETADIEEDIESPLTPQNGGNEEGGKKIDPVEHAAGYNGKLNPTATEPDLEFERQFGKYRIEALKIAEREMGPLNEGRRYEITELARAPDFNLEIFEEYTHQYNINGGNPYKIADFCKGYPIYKKTGDIVAAINGEQQANSGEVWVDPDTGIEVRW